MRKRGDEGKEGKKRGGRKGGLEREERGNLPTVSSTPRSTHLECAVENHHKQCEGKEPEEVPGEVREPVDSSVHPTHQL